MLTDEFQLFQQYNLCNQWQAIFISLLTNVNRKKKSLKGIRKMHGDQSFNYINSSEKMEDKIIKSVGGENVSGFSRLKVFSSQKDEFIKYLIEKYKDDIEYT